MARLLALALLRFTALRASVRESHFTQTRDHLLTGTQAQAGRGSSPVPHYWSLLLLLPETEQGHAPRAVGVDAVVPHRVALDEEWRVHGQ